MDNRADFVFKTVIADDMTLI